MNSEDASVLMTGITGILGGLYFMASGTKTGYGFVLYGTIIVSVVLFIQFKERKKQGGKHADNSQQLSL